MGFKEKQLYSLENSLLVYAFAVIVSIVLVNLQFAKLELLIYGPYSPGMRMRSNDPYNPGMRMRSRIFHAYVHRAILGHNIP